jgi:hypothetical protein
VKDNDQQDIDEFISNIKSSKPQWFLESLWVEKQLLLDKYKLSHNYVPKGLYKLLNNRLYYGEKRGLVNTTNGRIRVYMVKLMKFDNIL